MKTARQGSLNIERKLLDISVIIPTFRRGALLREAVRSVLSQQDASIEVIVNDDDPAASGREFACLDDCRVRYFVREANSGGRPAIVRNEGALRARGRILHFLDDDDVIPEGTYRSVLEVFTNRSDVDVVFGAIEPFGADEDALQHERLFFASGAERGRFGARLGPLVHWWLRMEQTFRETMLVNSAGYIRRERFGSLGGYDASLSILEDVEFWARAMQASRTAFLPQRVLRYRITAGSLMSRTTGVHHDEAPAVYRSMHQRFRRQYGALDYVLAKGIARTVARLI